MVGQPAGFGVLAHLVDVVPENAAAQARVPVSQRLQIVEWPPVVARVPYIQVGTHLRLRQTLLHRVEPAHVLIDGGGEAPLRVGHRRVRRIVQILDGDADSCTGRLLEEFGVQADELRVQGRAHPSALQRRDRRPGHVHGETVHLGFPGPFQVRLEHLPPFDAPALAVPAEIGQVIGQKERPGLPQPAQRRTQLGRRKIQVGRPQFQTAQPPLQGLVGSLDRIAVDRPSHRRDIDRQIGGQQFEREVPGVESPGPDTRSSTLQEIQTGQIADRLVRIQSPGDDLCQIAVFPDLGQVGVRRRQQFDPVLRHPSEHPGAAFLDESIQRIVRDENAARYSGVAGDNTPQPDALLLRQGPCRRVGTERQQIAEYAIAPLGSAQFGEQGHRFRRATLGIARGEQDRHPQRAQGIEKQRRGTSRAIGGHIAGHSQEFGPLAFDLRDRPLQSLVRGSPGKIGQVKVGQQGEAVRLRAGAHQDSRTSGCRFSRARPSRRTSGSSWRALPTLARLCVSLAKWNRQPASSARPYTRRKLSS